MSFLAEPPSLREMGSAVSFLRDVSFVSRDSGKEMLMQKSLRSCHSMICFFFLSLLVIVGTENAIAQPNKIYFESQDGFSLYYNEEDFEQIMREYVPSFTSKSGSYIVLIGKREKSSIAVHHTKNMWEGNFDASFDEIVSDSLGNVDNDTVFLDTSKVFRNMKAIGSTNESEGTTREIFLLEVHDGALWIVASFPTEDSTGFSARLDELLQSIVVALESTNEI